MRIFDEKFAKSLLTAFGEVLITPLNDGGAAAGDEILRPGILGAGLKKGLQTGSRRC